MDSVPGMDHFLENDNEKEDYEGEEVGLDIPPTFVEYIEDSEDEDAPYNSTSPYMEDQL